MPRPCRRLQRNHDVGSAISHDGAGNILSIGPSEDGGTDLFAYDGTSRLRESRFFVQQRNPLDTDLLVDSFESGDTSKWNRTQHWESSTLLGYVFDEHGNLLQEKRNDVPFRTHATNGATNRLTSGASYDAAGNLTLYDNVTTTFDALNRVVKRQASGGTPLYFLYTADDERTVTYDSEPSHPVYLRFTLRDFGGKLIRKVNETSSTTLVADEDVIFRGDQPLAKVGSSDGFAGFHLSLDHLGSVRTTTNGDGTLVARKKYYPFGEEATPFFEQAAITLKYTGHERDAYDPAATGDDRDYMHARFASPITGRFLTVDPVLEASKTLHRPQRWNRYAYALNNPIVYTDPTGETIFVVTYTTGNSSGDDDFRRAAYTRAVGLRMAKGFDAKKDRVLVRGVTTKQDLAGVLKEAAGLEKTYGKIGEFSLFSHAGPDRGPTFQYGTNQEHQFLRPDLGTFKGNWEAGASARFYGCNTGVNFSRDFAEAQGITAYGYTDYTLFSSEPGRFRYPSESGPLYLIQTEGGLTRTLLGLTGDRAIPMEASNP